MMLSFGTTSTVVLPRADAVTAEVLTTDLAECCRFASFWCEVTDLPHLTLTAILPDGPTTTATFERGDADRLGGWITNWQANGENVYYQPNETPSNCDRKPSKKAMEAVNCRHADIDPRDPACPLAEERDRLI